MSQVSGGEVLGSHVTSSLQGAPFSKNCTMVSLFKSGLRGLVSKVSGQSCLAPQNAVFDLFGPLRAI